MAFQPQPLQPQPLVKTSYGHCSSYFTEADDEGIFAQREEARKQARAIARETQRILAEELSNITCDEYQDDVLDHMEQLETETLPDVNFIDMQTEIQWTMRPYLLDFLVEAHASFQLLPETLYLSVNILDRYCSRRVVYKRHYQLVGCAALLIAAKYGDRKDRVPTVKELKSMCCSVYEEEMFTQMEWHVLVTLNWTIGHPTVDGFLQIILSEEAYDAQVDHLTSYLCEIALYHREFVPLAPSTMSRTALALARCILGKEVDNTQYWSGRYDYGVFVELYRKAQAPSRVLAQKYATPKMSSVAQTLELFVMRQAQMATNAQPQTPPVGMPEQQRVMSTTMVLPQTPQKGSDAYGYMTPPFTPEQQVVGQGAPTAAVTKPAEQPMQWVQSTYTPPSSTEKPRTMGRALVQSQLRIVYGGVGNIFSQ